MRSETVSAVRVVAESIADLTIEEADVVLEAVRGMFRIVPGPTTNGDAKRLLERLEETPLEQGAREVP